MKQEGRHPLPRTGRKVFEELLESLLRDRRETARIQAALKRRTALDGPCFVINADLSALQRADERMAAWIPSVRNAIETAEENHCVHPDILRTLRRDRRRRRKLQGYIPARCFLGVPLVIPDADLRRVAKIERQAVPLKPDAESALLLLPVSWLRAMHEFQHRGTRPRTRALLAADCATPLYEPQALRDIIERELGNQHLRFLARVIARRRVPEEALCPAGQADLRVDFEWRQPAPGIGGRLRQLGLLFVGMLDGQRTLYIPEGARPVMALLVGNILLEREAPGATQIAETLKELSIRAAQDRMRRVAFSAPGLVQADGLPTRRSRIRYMTPGPDRVVELEVVLQGSKPRILRRICISYQRPIGALHEAIQLAFGLPNEKVHYTQAPGPVEGCRLFLDPAHDAPLRAEMDEWRIPIWEALTHADGTLVYTYGRPTGRRVGVPFDIRRIALHAPETVAAEPRVVWADGVLAPMEGADTSDSEANINQASFDQPSPDQPSPDQASLDAANVFLERLDP